MKGLPSLLKQSAVVIIAAVSLVGSTLPLRDGTAARNHTYNVLNAIAGNKPRGGESRFSPGQPDAARRTRINHEFDNLPLSFEINRGQADPRARFISRSSDFDLAITPTETLLTIGNSLAGDGSARSLIRMSLLASNPEAAVAGLEELPCETNYFIGNDPEKWRSNVASYSKVECRDVYPGIDLVYYGTKRQLEYDFIVAPGARHQNITMRFDGADSVSLDDGGDLVIGTATGEVHHRRPVVYQRKSGVKKLIAARYVLKNRRDVSFEIGRYDTDQVLVIDPVLTYATYFGSRTGGDYLAAVTVDAAGNGYVVGTTDSTDLATTPGALQSTNRLYDVFVAKLNPAGTAALYVTYLGGSGLDNGDDIAVDLDGNAFIAGRTSSSDFPTTPGSFQSATPDTSAPFIAKLNASGTRLVYATYLGGRKELVQFDPIVSDSIRVAVDGAGQATIAGNTKSTRFPTTPGAIQPKLNGATDVFVARLNAAGSALVYGTYLGGEDYDIAICLALDAAGNACVGGLTSSSNFPTTKHAYRRTSNGFSASFVAKFDTSGDRLIYSTLLPGELRISGVAVDLSGNAYVTGSVSSSPNMPTPTTPGALQPAAAGASDAVVMKLNASGSDLVYSTFLGGSGSDFGSVIAVDSLGQAYVAGITNSTDFPLMSPLQSRKLGGPLFRSNDGGAGWDDVPALAFNIRSLAVDPEESSTLYVSTLNDIIKSTDGGTTWSVIAAQLAGSLAVDPLRPATLYLVRNGGLLKSTDAGVNWRHIELPFGLSSGLFSLVIDPKKSDILYANVQTAVPDLSVTVVTALADPPSMLKSTDGGASWTPVSFGIPFLIISYFTIDPQVTSTVYAVGDGFRLLKSIDSGATWFRLPVSGNVPIQRVTVDPTNSATLYAGVGSGLLKSTDGGASWGPPLLNSFAFGGMAIDPRTPSNLYVGSLDGLYQSTDGGATWRVSLDRVLVSGITIDPKQPSHIYAPAHVTNDVFVAKLNAAGTALVYSTFIGGTAEDSVVSIATDVFGNAFVGGLTKSADFHVTPNGYQPNGPKLFTGFVLRISDSNPPRITGVTIKGKKLLVSGEGFFQGAAITLDGVDLQTTNDAAAPSALLISRRGGKEIARGQTVTIRVRNADGLFSSEFPFTRSLD